MQIKWEDTGIEKLNNSLRKIKKRSYCSFKSYRERIASFHISIKNYKTQLNIIRGKY